MAIRKRGKAYQVDVTFSGVRERCTVSDVNIASACEAELLAALEAGKDPEPIKAHYVGRERRLQEARDAVAGGGRIPNTLAQLIERTKTRIWTGQKSGEELYKNAMRAGRRIGLKRRITALMSDDVDMMIDQMQSEEYQNGTINRYLSGLSVCFNLAEERGWIDKAPSTKRLPEGRGPDRYYTREEEANILQLAQQFGFDELNDLIVVLLDTGMRTGETLAIAGNDLLPSPEGDLQIVVRDSKNGDPRSIPLTARAQSVLVRRANYGPKMFQFSYDEAYRQWSRIRDCIGWQADRVHNLHRMRHTCASRLVQGGVDLKRVQEWMGHKSISVTLRYSHLAPHSLKDAVSVLELDEEEDANVVPLVTRNVTDTETE